MKSLFLIILLFSSILLNIYLWKKLNDCVRGGKDGSEKSLAPASQAGVDLLETPAYAAGDQMVRHRYYLLGYNEEHEQAAWVAYRLTSAMLAGKVSRTNNFRSDPLVKTGSSSLSDYKDAGYDRGHLLPAGDMKISPQSMSETFYMSNISPQIPGFNRGIWNRLEKQVRDWAAMYQELYVITGPVLKEQSKTIGKNRVTVPEYFYKVILDYTLPERKMIGFLVPHMPLVSPVMDFTAPVDSVEFVTGIDFFPSLPDSLEQMIESEKDFSLWLTSPEPSDAFRPHAVQCRGTTRKGVRCKRETSDLGGYCWQHLPEERNSGSKR